MQKKLILAEKPSQAQDLARGLGTFNRQDGFLENSSYAVTWAYGHLVSLQNPDDYDKRYSKWNISDLPIIPEQFIYKVDAKCKKQFNIIKKLIGSSDIDTVVICTDPGREGELIARLILKLAGNRKPVMRFWTSKALTPQAVREGFQNLKKAEEYNSLYESAMARQHADWIVGMNATRAFTVRLNELYSLGRVQTPVLSIIVSREMEIKGFKSEDYWTVKAIFRHEKGEYEGVWYAVKQNDDNTGKDNENSKQDNSIRIGDEKTAKEIEARITDKTGIIEQCKQQIKTEQPPLLFSLTVLQQEANRLFGFSASKSLEVAQALYENKKLISYPRTESQHLNPELAKDMPSVLNNLKRGEIDFDIIKCTVTEKNKRIFDSSKLTDHHALIPTGQNPSGLTGDEKKLYELIVRRFIAVFYPNHQYKATTIITTVNKDTFKTTGRAVVTQGWKAVYGIQEKEQLLPPVQEKETAKVIKAEISERKTTPPARYTDATILAAMTNAQRFIEDKKLKKILKETAGLGTPATRAAILEILKNRNYIERKGKNILPTQKGIALIGIIKKEKIADPSYTAVWEQQLDEIAKGERKPESFMTGIKEYAQEIIDKAKEVKMDQVKDKKSDAKELGKCPECGKSILENSKSYYCSGYREGCKFSLWKTSLERLGKKTITPTQASTLLSGKQIPLKGLRSKAGKTFDAQGKLTKHDKYGYQVELVFS